MVVKLTKVANIVWNTVKIPDEWICGAIMKLSKKGDFCDHYLDITFLVVVTKCVESFWNSYKSYRYQIKRGIC